MKEKKGLEMAVTTVILIILSISVLTVLVIFFNSQTGFLSKFFKTQTEQSTVDIVVSSCNALVDRSASYAYCCEEKEVVFGGGERKPEKMTCNAARSQDWASERIGELSCKEIVC